LKIKTEEKRRKKTALYNAISLGPKEEEEGKRRGEEGERPYPILY